MHRQSLRRYLLKIISRFYLGAIYFVRNDGKKSHFPFLKKKSGLNGNGVASEVELQVDWIHVNSLIEQDEPFVYVRRHIGID